MCGHPLASTALKGSHLTRPAIAAAQMCGAGALKNKNQGVRDAPHPLSPPVHESSRCKWHPVQPHQLGKGSRVTGKGQGCNELACQLPMAGHPRLRHPRQRVVFFFFFIIWVSIASCSPSQAPEPHCARLSLSHVIEACRVSALHYYITTHRPQTATGRLMLRSVRTHSKT